MRFWVDVADSLNGDALGEGPLWKVSRWVQRRRLNQAGDFECHLASYDKRAYDLLQHTYVLRCRAIVTEPVDLDLDTNFETFAVTVGFGLIHDIQIRSAPFGKIEAVIRGPDTLFDLIRYNVGNFTLDEATHLRPADDIIDAFIAGLWSVNWIIGDNNPVQFQFNQNNILEALTQIAAITGDMFALSGENSLTWYTLPTNDTANIPDTHIGIIVAGKDAPEVANPTGYLPLVEGVKETIQATEISIIENSHELATRIYAFGGGTGGTRLNLQFATTWPDGVTSTGSTWVDDSGITWSYSGGYITNDDAAAIYGVRTIVKEWPAITPVEFSTPAQWAAGNTLLKAAVTHLRNVSKVQRYFRVRLRQDQMIATSELAFQPGRGVGLVYYRYVDGDQVIAEHHSDLRILECIDEIDGTGIHTTELLLGNVTLNPRTEEQYLVELARASQVGRQQNQFTGLDLGTATQTLDTIYANEIVATTFPAGAHTHTSVDVTDFTEAVQDIIGALLVDSSTIDVTYNDAGNSFTIGVIQAGIDHGSISGLADDDHTIYALLAGRASGQTLNGGNAANENLTLHGTAHATKTTSYILLQPNGGNVGVGVSAPSNAKLEVEQIATTGNTLRASRNLAAANTNAPVAALYNNNSGDDQATLYIESLVNGTLIDAWGGPLQLSVAGSGTPGQIMRKANGAIGAMTQVLADELMAFFGARGATGASFSNSTVGLFGIKAAENFSGSNQGAYATIETAPIGSASRAERVRVGDNGRVRIGPSTITPASILHAYENTSAVDATAGLTIEQDGAGDAVVHHYLTGGQIWSSGIDNSDSDVYAISPAADLNSKVFRLTSTGDLTINGILRSGTAAPAGSATPLSFVSDGVTSSGTWTINVTSGTAITVIANGAGDVGDILFYDFICDPSSGTTGSGGGTMTPGTNQDLFNDGGNICQLQCNADGSVTVQRTAGTLTYVVSLRLFWQ